VLKGCRADFGDIVQPIAFGVSRLQFHISIDDLFPLVSFAAFRRKETNGLRLEIEIE